MISIDRLEALKVNDKAEGGGLSEKKGRDGSASQGNQRYLARRDGRGSAIN